MIKVHPLRRMMPLLMRAVALACATIAALGQPRAPIAIYCERGDPLRMITTPTMFNGSGSVVFEVRGRGLFIVDTAAWLARQVPGIPQMADYEFSTFVRRAAGGVACQQKGNAGTRLWKFDEHLRVWSDTLPFRVDTLNMYPAIMGYTDNTALMSVSVPSLNPPLQKMCASFDGCDSWPLITDEQLNTQGEGFTPVQNDGIGGFWLRASGAEWYMILHPLARGFDDNQAAQTPIRRDGRNPGSIQKAFTDNDSIIWIRRAAGTTYLGVGALGDTVVASLSSTITTAEGRTISVTGRSQLVNTATKRVFLIDSATSVYEYRSGRWHIVDTLKHVRSRFDSPVYSKEIAYYRARVDERTSGFVVLHLADSLIQELRIEDYYGAGITRVEFPAPHPSLISTYIPGDRPLVTLSSGRGYVLNSVLRDFEECAPLPMLYGIGGTAQDGLRPLIASYHGYLVRPEGSGVGRLVSSVVSGYHGVTDPAVGPIPTWLTTRGLLTPAVSSAEILFPGNMLRQFDRQGRFIGVLDQEPSTCALRVNTENILIGNGTTVRRWRSGRMIDSTDVRSQLTQGDTIGSGFLSSLILSENSAVVGFVSGLHVLDSESQDVHGFLCGGIVRSTDGGQSWTPVTLPHTDPYFLGTVAADNGVLIASYTTLVRDTMKMKHPFERVRLNEELYTTMQDCHIIRSADGGLTWQIVFSRPMNAGFRFLGGSGVLLKNGRLLINGIDGVMESLDNGMTWDFHETGFIEPTNVISLFTDEEAQDVYYCTPRGVFKSQLTTSVHLDDHSGVGNAKLMARSWFEHQAFWTKDGMHCCSITDVIGVTRSPEIAPLPGIYRVHLSGQNGTTSETILVTPEK